jgi:HEAT repeat protein
MTTPLPKDRADRPSRRGRALLRVFIAVLLLPASSGCSGGRPWKKLDWPWRDREKAARLAERYGTTANQRIEAIREQARAARGAGPDRQLAFTQDLTRRVLEEHDPRVRCEIVSEAAAFDTPGAASICRGALQDPDQRVRIRACEVWRTRGGPDAVVLLTARYRADTDLDVRLRALRMLGELRDTTAIPVLAEALEDPDPAVQYRAVAALKEVSGRDLGNDVNAWRAWAADPAAERSEVSIAERFRQLF